MFVIIKQIENLTVLVSVSNLRYCIHTHIKENNSHS